MDDKQYRYEFVITGISEKQAARLMEYIVSAVEFVTGKLYGGFVESEDEPTHNPSPSGRSLQGEES